MKALLFAVLFFCAIGCDSNEPDEVEVRRYEGAPITPEMAGIWRGHAESTGLVVLEYGPEDSTQVRLSLFPGTSDLPAFMGMVANPGTATEGVLRSGYVAIEKFDVHGIVSGEVRGRMFRGAVPAGISGSYFWVDLSNGAVRD